VSRSFILNRNKKVKPTYKGVCGSPFLYVAQLSHSYSMWDFDSTISSILITNDSSNSISLSKLVLFLPKKIIDVSLHSLIIIIFLYFVKFIYSFLKPMKTNWGTNFSKLQRI